MHIEQVHEYADPDQPLPEDSGLHLIVDGDNPSVSRRDDQILSRWYITLRVPEKPYDKKGERHKKKRRYHPARQIDEEENSPGPGDKRNPLGGDRKPVPIHRCLYPPTPRL